MVQARTTLRGLALLAVRPERGVLIQNSGAEAGRVHAVGKDGMILGGGAGCAPRFADATIALSHARVVKEGGRFVIEDLGSRFGSYVNDLPVLRAPLRDGDRVRLGFGAAFRFYVLDEVGERGLRRQHASSVRDGLTGLFNRRYAEDYLEFEVGAAARHRLPLCAAILGVDRLGSINDMFGHLAGDAVIRSAADIAGGWIGPSDLAARVGGDEILIVTRGALARAAALADRLRGLVEEAEVRFARSRLRVTVSAGCASLAGCEASNVAAILEAAGSALRRAKEAGGNRVIQAA